MIAKHPAAEVVFELGFTPNAMNLNNVVKEKINSKEIAQDMKMVGNEIECNGDDVEMTLIDTVKDIVATLL